MSEQTLFSKEELEFLLRATNAPWWEDPTGVVFSSPARKTLALKLTRLLKKKQSCE